VDVLEQDQRRVGQQPVEQRRDGAVQAGSPEGRLELVDLARRRHVDVQRHGQERNPGEQLRRERLQPLPQPLAVRGLLPLEVDGEQGVQQVAEDEVRRRAFVLLAGGGDRTHVGGLRADLLDDPGLADPGVTDELDERPEAHPRGGDGGA
jgi:hypothetical protein